MRLREKLLLVILASILINSFVVAIFVINQFISGFNTSLTKEIKLKWEKINNELDNIKHYTFNYLINLGNYIKVYPEKIEDSNYIKNVILNFKPSLEFDQILVIDEKLNVIYNQEEYINKPNINYKNLISSNHYQFPVSNFVFIKNRLFFISGYWIFKEIRPQKRIGIFLIYLVDNNFLTKLSYTINCNIVFFVNNKFVSGTVPPFTIKNNIKLLCINLIKTNNGTYNIFSGIIYSYNNLKVTLAILKSNIDKAIFIKTIVKSIVIAFFITTIISTILAIGLTSYFMAPLTNLKKLIDRFISKEELAEFKVNTKDEIGSMAGSFYTMAMKLLEDKKVIKQNLDKITFLQEYNENILNNIKAGIIVLNQNGKIEYCNNFLSNLLNIDKKDIFLKSFDHFFNQFFLTTDEKIILFKKNLFNNNNYLKQTSEYHIENVFLKNDTKSKTKFFIKFINIKLTEDSVKTLVMFEDVTKAEKLWEKMLQIEKLASLNLLSAGLAHEINNPLGTILSHVQYLEEIEKDKEKLKSIKWIESETKRIAELVKKLLKFSMQGSNVEFGVNINETLKEVVSLLTLKLKKNDIKVEFNFKEQLPNANINAGDLKQVIFNLLLNSIQAIKEKGVIQIKTFKKGDFLAFSIKDNGEGIDEENLKFVFDPFFTTKKGNKGTGLGLSICYNIIKNSGGDIKIKSEKGKGTEVCVYLSRL